MTDVYKRLAKKLDELPSGFPATESGVELRILERIFSPEEAEMALKLRPVPETVEAIAERLGKTVPEMQAILDNMAEKAQIGSLNLSGQQIYMLLPYAPGFMEGSTHHQLDGELIQLLDEYGADLMKGIGSDEPAVTRVVPVSTEIDAELQVHRYEDMRRMVEEAKSFQLLECWCRVASKARGNPCKHTLEICLQFFNGEGAFDKYPMGRIIAKEEALKVIADAEEEGLVHCTHNVEEGHVFVCNCCPCCCGLLQSIKNFNAPHVLAKSDFVASIDEESCAACGVCADERCPMEAIIEEDDAYRVLTERCIGCGVCVSTCPTESISLVRKPESEQIKPPADLVEWNRRRAESRGIEMKLD